MLQSDARAHIVDLHADLAIPTLYQRCCQHVCNTMHNFLNGIGPPDCIDLFRYNHEIHGFTTRQATGGLLYTPQTKLRCTERDYTVLAPGIWNQVPSEIRKLKSHEQFNKDIKMVNFLWTTLPMISIKVHLKTLHGSYHIISSLLYYHLSTLHARHVIAAHSDSMRNQRLLFRAFVNKDLKSNQTKAELRILANCPRRCPLLK